MPKKIIWDARAITDLRAIDQATALRILRSLAFYVSTNEGDIKRLKDVEPPELRLRVGDYRIRFHDFKDSIRILTVKHRREAYR
jgi:mRNA-degrading endonuclease RelE of RelBE toxin-antitoxin system